MNKNKIFAIITLMILLQFPFIVLSIVGHELIHQYDYRNIEKTNESFCFGSCGEGFGTYTFIPNEDQRAEAMRIHQTTEIRAWSFTILTLIIYLIVVLYFLIKLMKGGKTWEIKQQQ